jgi:PAS domain S-box-containing protein
MDSELSRVVDTLPGLLWTALPNGDADYVNRRWCEYTGLTAAGALGRGWLAAIHPADLAALLQGWNVMLASGEAHELEARLRRFDGVFRWFAFRAQPVIDGTGAIVKWCGVNTDIEDRKRAEHELRERASHFRAVADCLPALIAVMSPAGELENVNRQVLDYFALPLDRLRDWSMSDLVHPDDLPAVVASWTQALRAEASYDVEHRMRRADGVYRWFHVRGEPLRDEDGRVTRWYVLQTDIDERKQAEALLAAERQVLEMVADGAPMDGVLATLCHLVEAVVPGCSCSVVLVDPSGARIEHAAAPSIPPDFVAALNGRPVGVDSGPCAMAACLNEQVICDDLSTETRWLADGWPKMAMTFGIHACWSIPFSSSGGKVLGAFALYYARPGMPAAIDRCLIDRFTHLVSIAVERVQDVTQRRHTEQALDRVRSELAHVARVTSLGALAASIAHEVNQPLSGIITNASTGLRLLASDPPNIDSARETVERTLRDGRRAAEVIARLRELFSKKQQRIEAIDLNDAAREVIALASGEVQRNGVTVQTVLSDNLPAVAGDRVQLQQVILNFLLNASEALRSVDDRPRHILVRTEREGDERVRLSVRDSGPGVAPDEVERLFDAFYTTKAGGMGIGLSVSRTIIESHHGEVRVSANDGPGATFAFSLAAAEIR